MHWQKYLINRKIERDAYVSKDQYELLEGTARGPAVAINELSNKRSFGEHEASIIN